MSKTSYVAALCLAVWLAVAWRWSGPIADNWGLLIAGTVTTLFAAWYIKATQNFAERNPAQALLEGTEFLEWSRIEAAAKGLPPTPDQPLVEVRPAGILGAPDA